MNLVQILAEEYPCGNMERITLVVNEVEYNTPGTKTNRLEYVRVNVVST